MGDGGDDGSRALALERTAQGTLVLPALLLSILGPLLAAGGMM